MELAQPQQLATCVGMRPNLLACSPAAVLEVMRAERVQPVTRTYNTVMIACNTSGQWQVGGRRLAWGWTGGVELPATAWHDGRPAAWSGVYLAVCHWVGGWVGHNEALSWHSPCCLLLLRACATAASQHTRVCSCCSAGGAARV